MLDSSIHQATITEPLEMRFICEERRGTVIRQVKEVPGCEAVEWYLKHHMPAQNSPLKEVDMIYDPLARTFLVDRVGAMFKGVLDYEGLPDVHVVFWDKILWGREQLCRAVARRVASEDGAPGVCTAMPLTSRITLAFAKRIGFKVVYEGSSIVMLTLLFT